MYSRLCYLFSRSDRLRFLLLLFLMLGGSFMEIGTLGAVPLFVAAVMGKTDLPGSAVLSSLLSRFGDGSTERAAFAGGLLLILLFLARTLYFMFSFYFQERLLRNRQIALSSRLFRAWIFAPYAVQRTRNSSAAMENVIGEAERLINLVLDPFLSFLRNCVVAVTVLGILIWFDPLVSMLAFLSLALAGGGFMYLVHSRLKVLGERGQEGRRTGYKAVSEGVGISREAAISGCREYFSRRLHRSMEQLCGPLCFANSLQKCLWPSMELITVLVLLGTMAALIGAGRKMESIAPTLALLTVCLARLKGTLTELMFFFSQFRYNYGVLESLTNELKALETPETAAGDGSRIPMPFNREIAVENLNFTFSDAAEPVLKNVNLKIQKGQSAAFVGQTGSGKSTMADIILGLLTPDSGTVKVDGQDIRENPGSWQASIGFVPQEIYLLDDTIAANVALGVEKNAVDKATLDKALAAASLSDFIASLPEGTDTVVGERGVRLSGGQRQRIGIARALYKNPSVIVFDEATSALDTETESQVVAAMEALKSGRTMIFIAHRLSTVRSCNAVFHFENGGVEKFNSLEELQRAKPSESQ